MTNKWNITKLIVAGSLGVVYLILALPGGAIVAITGLTRGWWYYARFFWRYSAQLLLFANKKIWSSYCNVVCV